MMKTFKIDVKRPKRNIFVVPLGVYKNPEVYYIEPDAASASYEIAYAILHSIPLKIENLGSDSVQGDVNFAFKLKALSVDIEIGSN